MGNLSIVESVIGILVFNEDDKLVDKALYPTNHQEAADRVLKVEAGVLVDEVGSLIETLKSKCDQFILENEKLADKLKTLGVNVTVEKPSSGGEPALLSAASRPASAVQGMTRRSPPSSETSRVPVAWSTFPATRNSAAS